MIRTQVGYAGGTSDSPTYSNIGDHSETVRVDYDPSIITYEELLEAFWSGHDAAIPPYSQQYRSAIFFISEQQHRLAMDAKQAEEIRSGKKLYTAVEPDTGFHLAEDYHQKYYLKENIELVTPLHLVYPDPAAFRDSTAVARLNGYVGGYGDIDSIKKNLDSLGLSESGKETLLKIAESGLIPGCPVKVSGAGSSIKAF